MEANGVKLVVFDFSFIGDVAIRMIDAIEHACGWIATRGTPKRIACDNYIEEIKNSELDPLVKAAKISTARKDIKDYINQTTIVSKAIKDLEETAKPEAVDEDWINLFMDKARLVSDEEVQQIWAKLLADECNDPNSVPKGLLFILERMSKEDAEMIVNICRTAVRIDKNYFPIILSEKYESDYYKQYGIDYESLLQLDKLGLIEKSVDNINEFLTSTEDLYGKTTVRANYYDNEIEFPGENSGIPVGKVLFTKDGQALCKAIKYEKLDGFWEDVIVPWSILHGGEIISSTYDDNNSFKSISVLDS